MLFHAITYGYMLFLAVGHQGSNTLYTFDFFVPKTFVESDTAKDVARFCSHGEGCKGAPLRHFYCCRYILLQSVTQ